MLRGEALTEIGRALDMAIFSFGPAIPWVNAAGVEESRSRFALHVQCPFRMSRKALSIVADSDMPAVFDAKARSLRPVLAAERPTVQRVGLAADGSLTLSLSGDVTLRVLPPAHPEREAWRFFDRRGDYFVFPC